MSKYRFNLRELSCCLSNIAHCAHNQSVFTWLFVTTDQYHAEKSAESCNRIFAMFLAL